MRGYTGTPVTGDGLSIWNSDACGDDVVQPGHIVQSDHIAQPDP